MFVGHYAVSLWAKARDKGLPLWALLLAVQFVDVLWAVFVLVGIEHYRLVPGITQASPLDLYYMPYTHSLLGSLGWALLVFWIWFRWMRRSFGSAVLLGVAVFSHWVMDLLVHRPDLPLWDNSAKVGLGLWNHAPVSFSVEVGLLTLTMYLWYRASQGSAPLLRVVVLWILMVLSQVYSNFGPPPTDTTSYAIMAIGFYFFFAGLGRWCEPRPAAEPA
jgi:membrane-bound metal-dependent hydrolase YbcI (DUF457 family)